MIIKKNQLLLVKHNRKGTFKAIALEDFDTEKDEFYKIAVEDTVCGMSQDWMRGERIPCRASLCEASITN